MPFASNESNTCAGFSVLLHVGVPPPPEPQIFEDDAGLSRAAPPLPRTLHGTAGEQLTSVAAPTTNRRIWKNFALVIMMLHTPFSAFIRFCPVTRFALSERFSLCQTPSGNGF
jgi:hypothetical protein